MPVAQNSHAWINAAFLLEFNKNQTVRSARIVYGGINPQFVHASKAEQYLIGKNPFESSTLMEVYKIIDEEVVPDFVLPCSPPAYRKGLAISLFYKVRFTYLQQMSSYFSNKVYFEHSTKGLSQPKVCDWWYSIR